MFHVIFLTNKQLKVEIGTVTYTKPRVLTVQQQQHQLLQL